MGLLSDIAEDIGKVLSKFIPGPFYTDYPGDYPEDQPDNNDNTDSGSSDK